MAPDASAQFRKPVLDLWAGLNGINLGYVGGTTREIIETYASFADASNAYRVARESESMVRLAVGYA